MCPYRHNDIARYTTIVCKKWQQRECLNKDCVMLHPGGLGVLQLCVVICVVFQSQTAIFYIGMRKIRSGILIQQHLVNESPGVLIYVENHQSRC